MDWRNTGHLKREDFRGYRTYSSMSAMNNVKFNQMQMEAKPQIDFPVPNHHLPIGSGFMSPSKMNKSSQQDQVFEVASLFGTICVEGQTVPFVDFSPELYEWYQLIPTATPMTESEYRSVIDLLPQEKITFPQPSYDESQPVYRMKPLPQEKVTFPQPSSDESQPVYRMKPHVLNPEAEEYIPRTMRRAKPNPDISPLSRNSISSNTPVDDGTTMQDHCNSIFSPVTKDISQTTSVVAKEAPLASSVESHNFQEVNSNCSLNADDNLLKDSCTEEKPMGDNVELDNSSSQKHSFSISECVLPDRNLLSTLESQHDDICNSSTSCKENYANTDNANHINPLTSEIKNANSSEVLNGDECSDNEDEFSDDEENQCDSSSGSSTDSDSEDEDSDSQCSEESDSDDSICFGCQGDNDEIEDTKLCHNDSFICFENGDADESICFECDSEEESQNEDKNKRICNGHATDDNVTRKDNELTISDVKNPSEEEDSDYDCDLFQVELGDSEWDSPMGGLLISNLVSYICPSEISSGSQNKDDLLSEYSFDDVDCCPSLALANEEVVEANKRWNVDIANDYRRSTPQKVKFSDDVEIYLADDWCRKGPWEECARDRMRFRRRIEETETVLSPVLTLEHRFKVLKTLLSTRK